MAKSHTLLSQPIRSYNRNHKKFAYSCFSRAWSWRPFFFFSSDWLKCTVFSNCFNQPFPHSAPVGSGGEQSDRVEERAWGEATFERRENEFKFTNETKSRLGRVDRFIQISVYCHHKLRASAFVGGTSKSLFLILC